jgi:hypothetical protein
VEAEGSNRPSSSVCSKEGSKTTAASSGSGRTFGFLSTKSSSGLIYRDFQHARGTVPNAGEKFEGAVREAQVGDMYKTNGCHYISSYTKSFES